MITSLWRTSVARAGLLAVLAGALTCPPGAARAAAEDAPWYRRALLGLEISPTGTQFAIGPGDTDYASHYYGWETAQMCKAAGGEFVVMWARDSEYTYYDSKLEAKAPGLGKRDVLREGVEQAHKLGLAVVAYCVQQYCSQTLRQHPEWRMVAADGQPIDRVCFRSGYLEYMKRLLAELVAYGVDAVGLDMVDQGFVPPYGCWCDVCRREFEAQYGHPMPRHPSWDEAWDHVLEFRYASSDHYEQELVRYVHSLNPHTTVYFNYHGNPPYSWEAGQRPVQHARNGACVSGETGLWNFGPLTVGLDAEFFRAARPGAPFNAAMQRGVRGYHDQTTRPLNDLRWELLTLLAHGAFVTLIDKTALDGWLDPVANDRIRALFQEAQAKRPHFGQPPVQEVGIYYSSRTRDWMGRDNAASCFMPFYGAQKAMVYEHIPWGVILDENVTLDTLRRFPIVLLPNIAILSAREVLLLRQYVEAGGNLIVTGLTGSLGWRGARQPESSLAGLIGAKLEGRLDSEDNWVQFPAGANEELSRLRGATRPDWPFLVKGPALLYRPVGATAWGELLKPHRLVSQQHQRPDPDWLMSPDQRIGPAILVNRLGRGTVLTFAASPDFATASELHIVEARKLLRNAVRFLDPKPLIEISAPTTVEAVVTDDAAERTVRVHLLGYNSPPQTTPGIDRPYLIPGLIEDPPMYRASLSLNRPVLEATALNPSTLLRRDGSRIELTVQDIHDVILLRY